MKEYGSQSAGLAEGWHLFSTSTATATDFLSGIPDGRLTLFSIDHRYVPEQARVLPSYEAESSVTPDRMYWAHVAPQDASSAGTLVPPSLRDPASGVGYFVQPSRTMRAHELGIQRVSRWDAETQQLEPLALTEPLRVGQAYWVEASMGCESGLWSIQHAVRLLFSCALEHSGLEVIPWAEWSTRAPSDVVHAGSIGTDGLGPKLVLQHTGTARTESIQGLETLRTDASGQTDLGAHFIVAADENGQWQVYEGVRFDRNHPPASIEIALMGTYEPFDRDIQETLHGYLPASAERERQPSPGAAVRLLALVAQLSREVPSLRGIYPYGQGDRAVSPGASLSPGKGALHLVRALNDRFFGTASSAADPVELSPWAYEQRLHAPEIEQVPAQGEAVEPKDLTPPLLHLIKGTDLEVSAQSRFRLDGVVYDRDLLEYSLNGVVLGRSNQSFSHELWLVPGRNEIELSAVDGSGNISRLKKQIIYDSQAPIIEVVAPDPVALAEKRTINLGGTVRDSTLKVLTLNGVPVTMRGETFVMSVDLAEMTAGLHVFAFWAIDEAGLSTERRVAFLADEHGIKFLPHSPADGAEPTEVVAEGETIGVHIDVRASLEGTDLKVVLADAEGRTEEVGLLSLLAAGAGPRFQRASLFFEDLTTIEAGAVTKIDWMGVHPENSEVSLNLSLFGPDDAPYSVADSLYPVLSLSYPEAAVSFSNVPLTRIDGHAEDEHLMFVRINEVITSTSSGHFSSFVKLNNERTDLRIVARDGAGLEAQVERTIIFDPEPPVLSVRGGVNTTVYDADYVLEGTASDSHLVDVVLKNEDTGEENVLELRDGAFSTTLSVALGLTQFKLVATDRANNVTVQAVGVTRREAFLATQAASKPRGLRAWSDGDTIHIRWRQPRGFKDGTPFPAGVKPTYRVYRDEVAVSDEPEIFYEGLAPASPATYLFYVTAVLPRAEGAEYESAPSDSVRLDVGREPPVAAAGELEGAASVSASGVALSIPEVVFSKVGTKALAHLAFVVRDEEGGEQVKYARSEQFAKEGSFVFAEQAVATLDPSRVISDIGLAAFANQVIIGWIEQDRDGSDSRVVLHKSEQAGAITADGGHAFRSLREFPKDSAWKRDLDMAYDHRGVHHMIWNEANKVYYFEDLQGEENEFGKRINVFDEQKRQVNHELVKYAHTAEKPCEEGEGSCCTNRYEDTYSLGIDPEDSLACKQRGQCRAQFGPYLERTEETYVENPSLHVSRQSVSIVARQTRMFDNLPRANASWEGLKSHFLGPLVPPPSRKLCGGSRPIWYKGETKEYRKGFRSASRVDQYSCLLAVPDNADALVALEGRYEEIQGFGKARNRYYAYDDAQGHPANWFQYTHQGLWHEDDQIKVAQRPIQAGAWSENRSQPRLVPKLVEDGGARVAFELVEGPMEVGFRQGAWRRGPLKNVPPKEPGGEHFHEEGTQFEETLLRWRISTLESFKSERAGDFESCDDGHSDDVGDTGPSYAKMYAGSIGQMFAVYERGTKHNPNDLAGNAIQFVSSPDGGQTWGAPKSIGQGYMPSLGVAARGEIGVLYYTADSAFAGEEGIPLGQIVLARSDDGERFDHTVVNQGFDRSSGEERAHAAKPISWRAYGSGADYYYGVPSLATYEDLWVASYVKHGEGDEADRIMTNRISHPETPTKRVITEGPAQATQNRTVETKISCVDQYDVLSDGCAVDADSLAFGTQASSFVNEYVTTHGQTISGQETLWIPGFSGKGAAAATVLPQDFKDRTDGLAPAARHRKVPVKKGAGIQLFRGDAAGNYERSIELRDTLFDTELNLQKEYQSDDAHPEDSLYLSEYGRAWAYSQGIALAQFARKSDPRASGLAEQLCLGTTAVWGTDNATGDPIILGWPFSWNTFDDDWRDMRLVTGADAWVIHGLGVYLSSDAAREAGSKTRAKVQACYLAALRGLSEHRAGDIASDPLAKWLMTGGVTTEGLKYSAETSKLDIDFSRVLSPGGRVESLGYYHILDVIGYDEFLPDREPAFSVEVEYGDGNTETVQFRMGAEDFGIFRALRKPAKAENVVTEHNLDVLSVLNHAIHYWADITEGISDEELRKVGVLNGVSGSEGLQGLVTWRDGVRDAIFERLWDPVEGRVITGGEFVAGEFLPNIVSAIDNCSWLSLSVDFNELPQAQKEKLVSCLDFTIENFTSSTLRYEGNVYHGAFYFSKAFHDRYVEQNDAQEELYHLEATTGLILGLLYFEEALAEQFPEASARYLQEATRLWSDMQRMVADNGLPYSTIPIKGLMTPLPSATAAIWFIDVYDHFASHHGHVDQPLKNYIHGANALASEYPVDEAARFSASAWIELAKKSVMYERSDLGGNEGAVGTTEVEEDTALSAEVSDVGGTIDVQDGIVASAEAEGARLVVRSFGDSPDVSRPWGSATSPIDSTYTMVSVRWDDGFGETLESSSKIRKFGGGGVLDSIFSGSAPGLGATAFNYAPVNSTDITLNVHMKVQEPDFGLGLKTYGFSANGYLGEPVSLDDHYIALSLLMVGEDGREAELGLGTMELHENGTFQYKGSIVAAHHDLRIDQDLSTAIPVARLFHKKDSGDDLMVAATNIRSATDAPKAQGVDRGWSVEGAKGEWYFQQSLNHSKRNHIKEVRLFDGTSGKSLVTISDFGARSGGFTAARRWAAGALVPRGRNLNGQMVHLDGERVVSETITSTNVSVTYLEDQALAIIAAVNRDTTDNIAARPWVEGMLSTMVSFEGTPGSPVQLPFAVHAKTGQAIAPYFQTGSQMLAVYSLLRYIETWGESPYVDPVRSAVDELLRSLYTLHFDAEREVLTAGMGDPAPIAALKNGIVPEPGLSVPWDALDLPALKIAALEDHVYAHFTLDLAERLIGFFPDTEARFAVDQALREKFWEGPVAFAVGQEPYSGRPVAYLGGPQVPKGEASAARHSAALYLLYAHDSGQLMRAKRSLDLLALLPVNPVSSGPQRGPRAFSERPAAKILAKRAARAFDPRQEEIAWNDYHEATSAADLSAGDWAGLLIAQSPKGFLGVDAVTMFAGEDVLSEAQKSDYSWRRDIDLRLESAYLSTVFSVLVSDPKPHIFDTLMRRLVAIDFMIEAIEAERPMHSWLSAHQETFEARLMTTITGLQNFCNAPIPTLMGPTTGGIEDVILGTDCADVSAQFSRLLTQRIGSDDGHLFIPLMERPVDAYELVALINEAYIPAYPRDERDGLFGTWQASFVHGSSPTTPAMMRREGVQQSYNDDALSSHVASSMRSFRRGTLEKGLRQLLEDGYRLNYELAGVDFIQTMNPASPHYWSREAAEFRALRGLSGVEVKYLLGGREQWHVSQSAVSMYVSLGWAEPGLTRGQMAENVRVLRRLLNLEADGRLPLAASQAGMSTDALHRVMRTGKLRRSDFDQLAEGLGLSLEQAESWAARFVFLSDESPIWVEASEIPSPSLFSLLSGDTRGAAAFASPASIQAVDLALATDNPDSGYSVPAPSLADDALYQKSGGALSFEGRTKDLVRQIGTPIPPERSICTTIRVKNHTTLTDGHDYDFSKLELLGAGWLYSTDRPDLLGKLAPQEVASVNVCVDAWEADKLHQGVDTWYSSVNLGLTNDVTGEEVTAEHMIRLRFEKVSTPTVRLVRGGVVKADIGACNTYPVENNSDHPVAWRMTDSNSQSGLFVFPTTTKDLLAGARDSFSVCVQGGKTKAGQARKPVALGNIALVNETDGETQSFGVVGYPADLVAYWPLDGHLRDVVGQNHGQWTRAPNTYVPGYFGTALSPHPKSPGFRIPEAPLTPSLRFDSSAESFVVMAWVRPPLSSSDTSFFVSNGGWGIGLGADGELVFRIQDGEQMYTRHSAHSTVNTFPGRKTHPDGWIHVTVAWDGSNVDFRFDSKGLTVSDRATIEAAEHGFLFKQGPLFVGGSDFDGSGVTTFNGAVDEVKIFRGRLEQLDVVAQMERTAAPVEISNTEMAEIKDCGQGRSGAVVIKEGYWSYEVLPNVVKSDGSEPFYVEVRTPPSMVQLTDLGLTLAGGIQGPAGESQGQRVLFADDGLGVDHRASDGIYVAGPFTYTGAAPTHFGDDPEGPVGVSVRALALSLGDPSEGEFTIPPSVGLIDPTLANRLAPEGRAADEVQKSAHFVNLCNNESTAQSELRDLNFDPTRLARAFYAAGFEDDFQFMVALSTNHVERIGSSGINKRGGQTRVIRDDTGGLDVAPGPLDAGGAYGSDRALEAVVYLDVLGAGINSYRVTHELMHRWGAYWKGAVNVEGTDVLLTDGNHYLQNVGDPSLLGFRPVTFEDQGGGRVRLHCSSFREATLVDQYLMGLIPAADAGFIPVLMGPSQEANCGDTVSGSVHHVSVADDIVARWGERPAATRTNYRIAFVGETLGRTMTGRELAFYETLAAHYTQELPEGALPALTEKNWVSIDHYFPHPVRFDSTLDVAAYPLSAPVLAPTQVALAQPEGLVGYWSFNGDLAKDESFLQHAARVDGERLPGRGGSALKGTLEVQGSALQFGREDAFMVSLWVYPDPSTTREVIIGNLDTTRVSGGNSAVPSSGLQGWEIVREPNGNVIVRVTDQVGLPQVTQTARLNVRSWNHLAWIVRPGRETVGFELVVNGDRVDSQSVDKPLGEFKNTFPIIAGNGRSGAAFQGVFDELQFYRGAYAVRDAQDLFGGLVLSSVEARSKINALTFHLDPDRTSVVSENGVTVYRNAEGLVQIGFDDGFGASTVVRLPASGLSLEELAAEDPFSVAPFQLKNAAFSGKFVDTYSPSAPLDLPWLPLLAGAASADDAGDGVTYVFLPDSLTHWREALFSGRARMVTLALGDLQARDLGPVIDVDDRNPLYAPLSFHAAGDSFELPDKFYAENLNILPSQRLQIEVNSGEEVQWGYLQLLNAPRYTDLELVSDFYGQGDIQRAINRALHDVFGEDYWRGKAETYKLEFSFPRTAEGVELPEWISGVKYLVKVEPHGRAELPFFFDPGAFVGYEGHTFVAFMHVTNVSEDRREPDRFTFDRIMEVRVKNRIFELNHPVVINHEVRIRNMPAGLYEVRAYGPDELESENLRLVASQRHVLVSGDDSPKVNLVFDPLLVPRAEDFTLSFVHVETKEEYKESLTLRSEHVRPFDWSPRGGKQTLFRDFEHPESVGHRPGNEGRPVWGKVVRPSQPALLNLDWVESSFAITLDTELLTTDEDSFAAIWTDYGLPDIPGPTVLSFDVKSMTAAGVGAEVSFAWSEESGERWRSNPLVLTDSYQTMVLAFPDDFVFDGYEEASKPYLYDDIPKPQDLKALSFVFKAGEAERKSAIFALDHVTLHEASIEDVLRTTGGIRVVPPETEEEEEELEEIIEGPNVLFEEDGIRPKTINPLQFNLISQTVTYLDILAGRASVFAQYYGVDRNGRDFLLESAWGTLTPSHPLKNFPPGGQLTDIGLNANIALLKNLRKDVAESLGKDIDQTTELWEVLFLVDPVTSERVGQLPIKIDLAVVGRASIDGPEIDTSLEPKLFFNDFEPKRGCTKDCDPTWGIFPESDYTERGATVDFKAVGPDGQRLVYENPALIKLGAVWLTFEEDLTLYEALSFRVQAPGFHRPRDERAGCVHVRLVEEDGDAWISPRYNIPVQEDRRILIPVDGFDFSENDNKSPTNRKPNFNSIVSVSFNFIPNVDPGLTDHVVYSVDTLQGHPRLSTGDEATAEDCETKHDDFYVPTVSAEFRGKRPTSDPEIVTLLGSSTTYDRLKKGAFSSVSWTSDPRHWEAGRFDMPRGILIHERFADTKARTIAAMVHQITHELFHKDGHYRVPVPCQDARVGVICSQVYNQPREVKSERMWREFAYNLWLRGEAEAVLNSLMTLREIESAQPGQLGDIRLSAILPVKKELGVALDAKLDQSIRDAEAAFEVFWDGNRHDKETIIRALLPVVQWAEDADGAALRAVFNETLGDLWGSGLEPLITESENPFRRLSEVNPYMYTRDQEGHYNRKSDPNSEEYDPRDQDEYWYTEVRPPFQGVVRVQYDNFLLDLDEEDGKFRTCGNVKGSPVPCASAGLVSVDPRPRGTIRFSGYDFTAKVSEEAIAPGPNYWSDTFENVWVDEEGLHLKITEHPVEKGRWYAAEVIADRSLGYGQYTYTIEYAMQEKPKNVVLGLFLWDPNRSAADFNHREIDIEFSRWGKETAEERPVAQFAIPPYTEGLYFRFEPSEFQLRKSDFVSTYVMDWQEDRILFRGYYGSEVQGQPFVEWKYDGPEIQEPGEESVRMNLWIVDADKTQEGRNLSPAGNEPVEAIIKSFSHKRQRIVR